MVHLAGGGMQNVVADDRQCSSSSCSVLCVCLGLSYKDILLPKLWLLVTHLGPQCGLRVFVDVMSVKSSNPTSHLLFSLLQLASDTSLHIIASVLVFSLILQNSPLWAVESWKL